MNELIDKILKEKKSMVSRERFETVLRHSDSLRTLEGDIIECGVWRGGFSIFLKHLFPEKQTWAADSFIGFQEISSAYFKYPAERHVPAFNESMGVSLHEVIENFKQFKVDPNTVRFLQGFVKDTLNPLMCPIEKIALLRIDVDAYSATREILTYLYDKVAPNGMIIFDDSCLVETNAAIKDYFRGAKIPLVLRHPETDEVLASDTVPFDNEYPCGCYVIKQA